jgi:putative spermidine/putrescine transport system permease protein
VPTVVVIAVSFSPTAILSLPPAGFSLRWYVTSGVPQFQRAALNTVLVTARDGARAADRNAGGTGARAARLRERNLCGGCSRRWSCPGAAGSLPHPSILARPAPSRSVLIAAHVALVLPFVGQRENSTPPSRRAASLGATRRVFRRVTLYCSARSLAGALFTVVVSNEFVVSLFISNRVTEILPVAMFNYVVNYTDPTIAALSSLFIAATFLVVWLADRYLNLGRVFLQH